MHNIKEKMFPVCVGEYISMKQSINDIDNSVLAYGMNAEYLHVVNPSGIVRTWFGVEKSSPRAEINHKVSLVVR